MSKNEMLRAACVQMTSGDEMAQNIAAADALVREAAGQGAQLIALPENALLFGTGPRFHDQVTAPEENPGLKAMRELAGELGIWLLIGSLAVKAGEKYANRSYLISADGGIAAQYDKIHLFDVDLPGGESHRESSRFRHGEKAVVAQTPWGGLGLSVCYDVRFPYLYRALAKAGAGILTVPAAFTRFTGGKGGWHVLNRARAMENGCFVLAPAQCGTHPGDRQTYGHSLIIGPWGDVLAEAGEAPGVITADIDLREVEKTRRVMPSLNHDRDFTVKTS